MNHHNLWDAQPPGTLSTFTHLFKITARGAFPFASVRSDSLTVAAQSLVDFMVQGFLCGDSEPLSLIGSVVIASNKWKSCDEQRAYPILTIGLLFYFSKAQSLTMTDHSLSI